jgi:hypothetical protein
MIMAKRTSADPCLIAVHLWDWTVPTTVATQEELLDRFVQERMCNALCIWPDHQPARLELPAEAIAKYDLPVVYYFYTENVFNYLQSHAWSGGRCDQIRPYVDHWVDGIVEQSRKRPGKVWWTMGHEHFDQTIARSGAADAEKGIVEGMKFASKSDAYRFYADWIVTDLHKRHFIGGELLQRKIDRVYKVGVDKDIPPVKYALGHDSGVPSTYPYLQERGIDPHEMFFGAGGTVPASAAYLFNLGSEFKFFWWECSFFSTGIQAGIAMIRGAARQYGRKWLMDHSPYGSVCDSHYEGPLARGLENLGLNTRFVETCHSSELKGDYALGAKGNEIPPEQMKHWAIWWPQHDKDGNRLNGLSWQRIQREWLWSYMSGADCVFQEAAAISHFIKVGDGPLQVTPYGQAAKQFYAFAADRCSDRGQTTVPVALLMDFYHGLDPVDVPIGFEPWRRGNTTWGSIPFNSGDHMANAFFEAAFPGQSAWPKRERPWKNEAEYAIFLRAGMDENPYERQTLVAGTWGDIFNVVLNNADPGQVDAYQSVAVLGDVVLDEVWLAKLESYVRAGGRVLVNAAQLPPGPWPTWLGCSSDGSRFEVMWVQYGDQAPCQDVPMTAVAVTPAGAAVTARTPQRQPLVLVNRVGAGEVWMTTPLHLMSNQDEKLWQGRSSLGFSQLGRKVLADFLDRQRQIVIDGRPLAHLVNRRANGDRLITVCNLDPDQWFGRIIIPDAAGADGRVTDLWNQKNLLQEPVGDDLRLHLVIPPWGIMVIEAPLPAAQ